MNLSNLNVDQSRLASELEQLATFSDAESPAVTRVLFSDVDMRAREFLTKSCQRAGLVVRTDAVGNIFARWEGADPSLPAVATGSHCDAIPHSGRYDGTVGVWGGLEAIRALQATGFQPSRSIELIMFTAEEPTRYGIGCLGSRLMAGTIEPNVADAMQDSEDCTLKETRAALGFVDSLDSVKVPASRYSAFVELHIEQGPELELEGTAIGIVTDIAAPAALRVDYEGSGGHAGAVLMSNRRDALLPAAELAVFVDAAAKEFGGEDTVATTGVLDVFPRAINSIPSRTYVEIDVRDTHLARRDDVLDRIIAAAKEIGARHQQETRVEIISRDPPAQCGAEVVSCIEGVCIDASLSYRRMISRAYHDCLFMALICPSSMIFIPCRDGVSHRPDEYSKPEEIAAGVEILARSLAQLSS